MSLKQTLPAIIEIQIKTIITSFLTLKHDQTVINISNYPNNITEFALLIRSLI